MIYLGIDPGLNGGIAAIEKLDTSLKILLVTKMPRTDKDIFTLLADLTDLKPVAATIEKVHSMPGQGVASTFKFGKGFGGLLMALTGLGVPYEEVSPRRWQKALYFSPRKSTESKTAFKNRLKRKAQELYPDVNVTLAVSDALLIMTYCYRYHEGLLNG